MYRATGAGKVEVEQDTPSAGIVKALLYNFDFDDYEHLQTIKTEFRQFLDKKVVPIAASNRGWIWMQGSASEIGGDSRNKLLSQNRVVQVAAYLTSRGIDPDQMQLEAIGEESANQINKDDDRDRSVRIWVIAKPPEPEKKRPPKKVPKTWVSQSFKIAMIGGISAAKALKFKKWIGWVKNRRKWLSRGIILDVYFFQIWDTTNNVMCDYIYFAFGLGFSANILPPVSTTLRGPWNAFMTDAPMTCWQFGNWARFTTIGVGSKSINYITMETPKGVSNVSALRINTGITVGAGAGSSIGDIRRIGNPERFYGH